MSDKPETEKRAKVQLHSLFSTFLWYLKYPRAISIKVTMTYLTAQI